ncbi:hypothetical protein K9O30_06205 [Clostridium bowmanii]|uniref:hypothetical protein n=1 Tax=Clostridium bowmanii TaxID=132925 RepID=UPI001C0AF630|nr:hypothetical protein [Clostridium bowmanii]MBU3188752.1 hypothetical protein [Clostridium bowmanii]MCA1073337.1 hypothetical protein [Clostridium bowmanii]
MRKITITIDNYLKILLALILTLILMMPIYIGINRISYSSDYNKIEVLENTLKQEHLEMIDAKIIDKDRASTLQYNIDKKEVELQYLNEKVKPFNFLNK